MHYLLVETEGDKLNNPLMVYFNGGPGGATLHLAFVGLSPIAFVSPEVGFVHFDKSWANNASLLFIDNPVGVGYSYGERKIDIISNDRSYVNDAL